MNKEDFFNDFASTLLFGEGQVIYAEPLRKEFAKWKRKFLVSPPITYNEMLSMMSNRVGVKSEPTRLTGVGLRPPPTAAVQYGQKHRLLDKL